MYNDAVSVGDRTNVLALFGSACQECGYARCIGALQFHHVDGVRESKSGRVDAREVRAYPERFRLLCANCHFEAHAAIHAANAVFAMCARCGVQFRTQTHRAATGRGVYCSRTCAHAGRLDNAVTVEAIEARFRKHIQVTPDGHWLWTSSTVRGVPVLMVTKPDGSHAPRSARALSLTFHGIVPPKRNSPHCGQGLCVRAEHLIHGQGITGAL